MKLFSIIVVSLNTKYKFNKTIQSIISQSVKNYEIVVVDGKSTDGTIELISKYKKFIKKKIIKKDKGIYFAMNRGIKLASNKWLIFLNSGDKFYSKDTLKRLTYYIKKYNKADVIVGHSQIKKKNYIYKKKYSQITEESLMSTFSHQSCVTKKILFRKNFETKYKISADFNFFKNLLNQGSNFTYINEIISITEAEGLSDQRRFLALKEFYNINKTNRMINFKLFKYFIIFIYFVINFFAKLLIPIFLQNILLKIKHMNKK